MSARDSAGRFVRGAGGVTVRVVKDTKLAGLQALATRLRDGAFGSVLVGVPMGATEEDGTSLAMIAAVHEFGSPERNIPQRSFLRSAIWRSLDAIRALNVASLRGMLAGKLDEARALGKLGLFVAGRIKAEIRGGDFVPNAPATIAAKGSSKPLIDTAQLLQSITYEIDEGQGGAGVLR